MITNHFQKKSRILSGKPKTCSAEINLTVKDAQKQPFLFFDSATKIESSVNLSLVLPMFNKLECSLLKKNLGGGPFDFLI